jgi:GntR family transcriptional repressor for pyruvate dehydrogenase complex
MQMMSERLYQAIAGEIRKLIDSGEFPVGSRLPGERDLAERFGVSRVTIREAEIALEALGLISIRTGSGVYVTSAGTPSADLPQVSAFDLTAARAVIEAEAAALASANITDLELAELEELIVVMSDPNADDATSAEADRQFHLTIARIAGNPVIEHMVQLIWRMRNELPAVRATYARVCHNDWSDRTDEHAEILAALRRRDPQASRNAMRSHFHRLFESMLAATERDALEELRRTTELNRERFLQTTRI